MNKAFVGAAGLGLALGIALVTPDTAVAQPKERAEKAKERHEKAKEAREDAKEERKENREERHEARKEVVEKRRAVVAAYLGGASPEEMKQKVHELIDARKDLAKARKDARQAEKERLKKYFKEAVKAVDRGAIRVELARHARTMAYLARVREVAEENKDTATVARIDELLVKEQTRHQLRMEFLTGHGGEAEEPASEGGEP